MDHTSRSVSFDLCQALPILMFCVLPGVIVLTTQVLALVLGKIRQPKVIAEVIGGILLGEEFNALHQSCPPSLIYFV